MVSTDNKTTDNKKRESEKKKKKKNGDDDHGVKAGQSNSRIRHLFSWL